MKTKLTLTATLTHADVVEACRDWYLARFNSEHFRAPPDKDDLSVMFQTSDYNSLEGATVSFTIETDQDPANG